MTTKALFNFLNLKSRAILKTAITMVFQSVIVSFPIAIQTEIIMATDATLTASKNDENNFEFLIFSTNGFNRATKANEGRKIPIVATKAP